MAWFRWLLIAALALLATLSVAHSVRSAPGGAQAAAATQYYCPMHPQVVQDHPGECPICSMTLVERSPLPPSTPAPGAPPPGTATPGAALELTLERRQASGLRTAVARLGPLAVELRALGVVQADESRVARVHSRFSGWVQDTGANVTGRRVTRGEVLAQLINLDLAPAQQEFLAARDWPSPPTGRTPPRTATSLGSDARGRLELFGLSESDIAAISRAGKPARTLALRSPITGVVLQKSIVRGAYVEPGMELFELADLSVVWVLADVYERDIARVHEGLTARVELDAYPGEHFDGKLQALYPELDPATRSLRARVELDNAALKLRPGMYAAVTLQLDPAQGVSIPSEALVDTGVAQYVFIARDGGRFEQRRVRAGARVGESVQILEGIAAGDSVVTTGNFLLDSESRLQSAIAGESRP
jgi:Cu(I)/Ag(I) efflux system membrane fusion protein